MQLYWTSTLNSNKISKQESCAIAKMTAQCALHMGALKIFGTPYTSTATIPNIFMGFCSGRPYECSYKI